MKRICTKCEKEKDVSEFRVRNKDKGTYSCWCKLCYSVHEKNTWKNSSSRRQSNYEKCCERRDRNRKFVFEYLVAHPCVKCGEKDPVVLTFDHIDPSKKEFSIAVAAQKTMSLNKIKNEISKCNVLCANCHHRKTAEQFGWYRFVNKG